MLFLFLVFFFSANTFILYKVNMSRCVVDIDILWYECEGAFCRICHSVLLYLNNKGTGVDVPGMLSVSGISDHLMACRTLQLTQPSASGQF